MQHVSESEGVYLRGIRLRMNCGQIERNGDHKTEFTIDGWYESRYVARMQ